jgi:hypothetical protein
MALSNLRSEVIELRNEGLEKDKILHSLINRIKEDEATVNNGQIIWRKTLKSFVHLRKDAMKNLWNVLRQ